MDVTGHVPSSFVTCHIPRQPLRELETARASFYVLAVFLAVTFDWRSSYHILYAGVESLLNSARGGRSWITYM